MLNDYHFLGSLRDAAELTTSYVAATTVGAPTHNLGRYNQLIAYIDVTLGSLTSVEVMVEFSPDGTNWYQETGTALDGSTNTISAIAHSFAADGSYRLPIPIKEGFIRISAKGTGTTTGSSLTISAALGVA